MQRKSISTENSAAGDKKAKYTEVLKNLFRKKSVPNVNNTPNPMLTFIHEKYNLAVWLLTSIWHNGRYLTWLLIMCACYSITLYSVLIDRSYETYKRFSLGHTYLLQSITFDLCKLAEAIFLSLLAAMGHMSYMQQVTQLNREAENLEQFKACASIMHKFLNVIMAPYILTYASYWILNVFNIFCELHAFVAQDDSHILPYLSISVTLFLHFCQAYFLAYVFNIYAQKAINIIQIEKVLDDKPNIFTADKCDFEHLQYLLSLNE